MSVYVRYGVFDAPGEEEEGDDESMGDSVSEDADCASDWGGCMREETESDRTSEEQEAPCRCTACGRASRSAARDAAVDEVSFLLGDEHAAPAAADDDGGGHGDDDGVDRWSLGGDEGEGPSEDDAAPWPEPEPDPDVQPVFCTAQCVVCLDTLESKPAVVWRCRHILCRDCDDGLVAAARDTRGPRCPQCRASRSGDPPPPKRGRGARAP